MQKLRDTLQAQAAALRARGPNVSAEGDAEELHQVRVAIRRARALLRAAEPLIDDARAESLRDDLGRLGRALGPARDLDVFIGHLRQQVASLDGDGAALQPLLAGVETARRKAYDEARGNLRAVDFERLAGELEAFTQSAVIGQASADDLVDREFRRLRKAMHKIDSDEGLHKARIQAKRVRYAAEVAEDAKVVARAKRIQELLGEHQDAVVAEERLRSLADPQTALVVGRLIERQAARRAHARAELPKAWRKLAKTR